MSRNELIERTGAKFLILSILALGVLAAVLLRAAGPHWWFDGNPPVIDPSAADADPNAMANVGQAKWMALEALRAVGRTDAAMEADIRERLIPTVFSDQPPATLEEELSQKAPLTLGQLKAIAKPFYDAFNGVDPAWVGEQLAPYEVALTKATGNELPAWGYVLDGYYPWDPANTTAAFHSSPATIGQVKAVFAFDPNADGDGDQLADLWELKFGFDTGNPDQDGNSIIDAEDDFDDDGLSNRLECRIGTDPTNEDTDGDSMRDGYEYHYGFDPTDGTPNDPDPARGQGPEDDPDGDGAPNKDEAESGCHPRGSSSGSNPMTVVDPDPNDGSPLDIYIEWFAARGAIYRARSLNSSFEFEYSDYIIGDDKKVRLVVWDTFEDLNLQFGIFQFVCWDYDPNADLDGDGLPSELELRLGYDPFESDTDGNGVDDDAEDFDEDNASNADELAMGTNIEEPDTDLDGIRDGDELPGEGLVNNAEADPDGANISIAAPLIGRWDFESFENERYPSTPPIAGREAVPVPEEGWDGDDPQGIPSRSHSIGSGRLRLPYHVLTGETSFTVTCWMRFEPGELDGATTDREFIMIGPRNTARPIYRLFLDTSEPNKVFRLWTFWLDGAGGDQQPSTLGEWAVPAALDDGEWHHIVLEIRREHRLWMDGAEVSGNSSRNTVHPMPPAGPGAYFTIGNEPVTGIFPPPPSIGGRIDRLRVYGESIGGGGAGALYRSDIDRDGIPDLIESGTRRWDDLNGNGVRDPGEIVFGMDPFRFDAPDADHDGDGLATLFELETSNTSPVNPDTDGDLLPDGWEFDNGLDPLSASGVNGRFGDLDGDGAHNLLEFQFGSDPNNDPGTPADTDGDGTVDLDEILGPDGTAGTGDESHPNDDRDDGQPIPSEERLSIRLGVGDESTSDSEDYIMNIFRVDPDTGDEIEPPYFTVRSGGHGQYHEDTYDIFRHSDTYTFQIKWQGSTRSSSSSSGAAPEGPDFDYTLIVQPVDNFDAWLVTEPYHPEQGLLDGEPPITGDKVQNAHDFVTRVQGQRVLKIPKGVDAWMDSNMNTMVEAKKGVRFLGNSGKDDAIEEQTLSVIIDVNNNNTDHVPTPPAGSLAAQVDNRDSTLDTEADREEHTRANLHVEGHRFSDLKFTVPYTPMADTRRPRTTARVKYRVRVLEGDGAIRIFGWQDFKLDPAGLLDEPWMLVEPGKTSQGIDADRFYEQTPLAELKKASGRLMQRTCFVEGVTYGSAVIAFEVIDTWDSDKVVYDDKVRIAVNVDRVEQPAAGMPSVVTTKDAAHTRGTAPHHVGARKINASTAGIRAVTGFITVRPPSFNSGGWRTQHTWMRQRPLRKQIESGDLDMGSSFWIGMTIRNGMGAPVQWVQTGLRWVQPIGQEFGTPPAAYIETGDLTFGPGLVAKSLHQASAGSADGLGAQVVRTNTAQLSNWENEPIRLEFVMFKNTGDLNGDGLDDALNEPWRVVYRDARPGKDAAHNANYFSLALGRPTEQSPPTGTQRDTLQRNYRSQAFRDVDVSFETSQSISFAPGLPGARAEVRAVRVASTMGNAPMPPVSEVDGKVRQFNWARTNFAWGPVTFTPAERVFEVKTGRRLANGRAEDGNAADQPHPWWNTSITDAAHPTGAGNVQIWDTRPEGFGAQN